MLVSDSSFKLQIPLFCCLQVRFFHPSRVHKVRIPEQSELLAWAALDFLPSQLCEVPGKLPGAALPPPLHWVAGKDCAN